MYVSRREFVYGTTLGLITAGPLGRMQAAPAGDGGRAFPIVDTHQHLWDLAGLSPPWVKNASEPLNRSYTVREYADATAGLDVAKAVYMEVDMDPKQHVAEAEYVVGLCRSGKYPTVAAVIGGRPAADDFGSYLKRFQGSPYVKGVRQVLHAAATKAGFCLEPPFVRGIRLLGELGLSFDLCLRPAELKDGIKLVDLCPDTRFIVDHCGNADPAAFRSKPAEGQPPTHDPDTWKRDMEQFARRRNVIGKISGIVARAPKNWTSHDLAPIVNHCLDVFGPDRVVFGGDWPVCLRGASYREWVVALREIVRDRPIADQKKLWYDNAVRFYNLV